MGNAVLVQQVYAGSDYTDTLAMVYPRHLAYCKRHGMDYCVEYGNIIDEWPVEFGAWAKLPLIISKIKQGYEHIIWLDADALIVDMDADLRDGCPDAGIGMAYHKAGGLPDYPNVGVMYVTSSPAVQQFINNWINWYPGPINGWRENGMLILLSKFSNVVVEIDAKYNSTRAGGNRVDNPVVEGFHGEGSPARRHKMMRAFLRKQAAKERNGENKQQKTESG